MIVTGLDLSLTSTGWARITDTGDITTGRIQSKGTKSATLHDRRERLANLVWRISEVASDADLIVIEQPAFSRTTGHMHDRSGLWWLTVDTIWQACTVVEVPPTVVKKYATGQGNADKDTVLLSVARRYPHVDVTGNDEADALILAAMGARHIGYPIDDMPLTHTAALSKVAWPLPAEATF